MAGSEQEKEQDSRHKSSKQHSKDSRSQRHRDKDGKRSSSAREHPDGSDRHRPKDEPSHSSRAGGEQRPSSHAGRKRSEHSSRGHREREHRPDRDHRDREHRSPRRKPARSPRDGDEAAGRQARRADQRSSSRHRRSPSHPRDRSASSPAERPAQPDGAAPAAPTPIVVELNRQEQGEIDARVKRAAAWQKLQASRVAEQEAAEKKEEEVAQKGGWNLEDEGGFSEGEDEAAPDKSTGAASPAQEAEAEAMDTEEGGDEVDPLDAFMADNDTKVVKALQAAEEAQKTTGTAAQQDDDEADPLDAFMAGNDAALKGDPAAAKVELPMKAEEEDNAKAAIKQEPSAAAGAAPPSTVAVAAPPDAAAKANGRAPRKRKRLNYDTESSSEEEEGGEGDSDDEDWAAKVRLGGRSKGEKLGIANHDDIEYPAFRRNFYIEVPELARMSDKDVAEYRKELNGIKCRGKNVPKPVKNWYQCGLSTRVLDLIRKSGFDKPMPIQAQALPVIMSGRDCIGIAETGSGKTLAFVLPMLRHIKDQPPLEQGDGPVALVCAPTRELVHQIAKDTRKFARVVNLNCVAVYGGSGVGSQISELKHGTEIVVCTPGRMIDILVTSAGKITNLRRVTYLVFDEADRMFDMGFEPQISRLHRNIRPDRQTVMFSATFPHSVENLARTALANPVEVQVGGRSVVNRDILQKIELRPEADRFLRLLEILGEYYEQGKILIFVASQDLCDKLFGDLLKVGYPVLSLHGAKDQSDRESTINDFKQGVSSVLIATSVAARGLDVKDLTLVVNYDCPNHHEDYVHRVGRTGRAGNKGTAITFISPEDEQYAGDLVKALMQSGAEVPLDLKAMADRHQQLVKEGKARAHGSGYGGSGFKFNEQEEEAVRDRKKEVARQHGTLIGQREGEGGSDDDEDGQPVLRTAERAPDRTAEELVAEAEAKVAVAAMTPDQRARHERAAAIAQRLTSSVPPGTSSNSQALPMPPVDPNLNPILAAAQRTAQQLAAKAGVGTAATLLRGEVGAARAALIAQGLVAAPMQPPRPEEHKAAYVAELEINDFPQQARFKVMHRETLASIHELTGSNVITKGHFYDAARGEAPGPGDERKIYLLIEGATPQSVKNAKAEIKRIIAEQSERAYRREHLAGGAMPGRYTVS